MFNNSIYIIGAGGVVNDAHLPAYKIAGYQVKGIFDVDIEKARMTASKFAIPNFYDSLEELLKNLQENDILDIAVPANAIINILKKLPNNIHILLQKPMGNNFEEAKEIVRICEEKNISASVNFQLRYAPFIAKAKELIRDKIGAINDIEINVNVFTPWHLWDFLFTAPRVEILYHSIHYIDLIKNLLGTPNSIYAKTTKHKTMPQLASVRSNIIMDYGELTAASIHTNHTHNFGVNHQESYIKMECEFGAIRIKFGSLINYPNGVADRVEYIFKEEGKPNEWQELKVQGSWFPHAFIGSMQQVLLAANKKIAKPDNNVHDCLITMQCVEAAYQSSKAGGVKLDSIK